MPGINGSDCIVKDFFRAGKLTSDTVFVFCEFFLLFQNILLPVDNFFCIINGYCIFEKSFALVVETARHDVFRFAKRRYLFAKGPL
jgi:hypothetical protein